MYVAETYLEDDDDAAHVKPFFIAEVSRIILAATTDCWLTIGSLLAHCSLPR